MYATCPRQYSFEKVWSVETPEMSRRYMDRGLAYHAAIEETCNAVQDRPGMSDDEIHGTARDAIERQWESRADRREYTSDAQFEYDRELTISAVQAYFEADGCSHARRSIGTERWVTSTATDVPLHGRVDNIVRTDDGLEIIDYKGSLGRIVSHRSAETITDHRTGDGYAGDIIKSVFQTAAYIEGVKALPEYKPGMDVECTFYAVMYDKDRQSSLDGIQVTAEPKDRQVGWIYETYYDDIWALIEDCYEGIQSSSHAPEPWEMIREHACEECEFRAMCPDYLGEEVRVDD